MSEERQKQMGWPDTDLDRRAWALAKVALGPDAPMSELIARAQEIKESLKG